MVKWGVSGAGQMAKVFARSIKEVSNANLVPIFSAFLAAIILNESFNMYHLLAMIIVFAGIATFEYQKRLQA